LTVSGSRSSASRSIFLPKSRIRRRQAPGENKPATNTGYVSCRPSVVGVRAKNLRQVLDKVKEADKKPARHIAQPLVASGRKVAVFIGRNNAAKNSSHKDPGLAGYAGWLSG